MTDVAATGLSRLRDRAATGDTDSGDADSGDGARVAIEAALEDRLRPMSVQVAGRTGVGKSAVLAVLESARLHADGLDVQLREGVPDGSEAEVVVYVLAGAVSAVDSAFLNSRPVGAADRTVVVLNKADTLDDPVAATAAASHRLGRPVLPVMGTIAAGLRRVGRAAAPLDMADVRAVAAADLGPADMVTVERFRAADLSLSARRRDVLIECVELRGLTVLVDAVRNGTAESDDDAVRILDDASGGGALIDAVASAVSGAAVSRDAQFHRRLQQISAEHRRVRGAVESYLASDEAVAAEMRCAAMQLGIPIETDSQRIASDQAVLWKQRAAASGDPAVRRAALALCRGYVRMQHR